MDLVLLAVVLVLASQTVVWWGILVELRTLRQAVVRLSSPAPSDAVPEPVTRPLPPPDRSIKTLRRVP